MLSISTFILSLQGSNIIINTEREFKEDNYYHQNSEVIATSNKLFKYKKPAKMGEEGSADSTIIVPTFKSKTAADKVINLQEMDEQDVKCLQTTGEFHALVTALSADLLLF